mmetsp:Transcript_24524/g.37049  ORF Transcript_24524/g.37049 Transcript_24524/m.37049 type:complete len:82 (+) Transcript_24524:295-540(+)
MSEWRIGKMSSKLPRRKLILPLDNLPVSEADIPSSSIFFPSVVGFIVVLPLSEMNSSQQYEIYSNLSQSVFAIGMKCLLLS